MTLSEYSHLKQQIKLGVGLSDRHERLLSALKNFFKGEINSVRRFEEITSIGMLLHVLELRNVLSEDNVEPLKKIIQTLPDSNDLLEKIAAYENSHVPREYTNYYALENVRNTPIREPAVVNGCPIGPMSATKTQRILQTVKHEIGSSWRDLARNLKIRECEINYIENNYNRTPDKASKLMDMYLEEKAEPDKWVFDLCDALDNTRRRDLSRSIRNILKSNV